MSNKKEENGKQLRSYEQQQTHHVTIKMNLTKVEIISPTAKRKYYSATEGNHKQIATIQQKVFFIPVLNLQYLALSYYEKKVPRHW